MDRIQLSQLTAGSVFKIGYFCLLAIALPFGLLCGLAAMGGSDTVQLNGRYVHGTSGLIGGIGLGIVMPAILAALMALGSLIMRVFARILPGLSLRGGARPSV